MAKDPIDIHKTIQEVEHLLEQDDAISSGLKASVKMLIMVVQLLTNKAELNSRNSSLPPSSDPNREKKKRSKSKKLAGGQKGHIGTNLEPIDNPDEIKELPIDRRTLPRGPYESMGFVSRQLFDIRISRHVTEYRAQVLKDQKGNEFVAQFPPGLTRPAQYGQNIKANAVYMSMYQLIPYDRIQTHFSEMFGIPISAGSLFNFNRDALNRLQPFLSLAKHQLSHHEPVIHADETGVNIDGKRLWLHNASSPYWTLIQPHRKRGQMAMDEIGVLADFTGFLVHDHWKPYYKYEACTHVLCNAHHKRELTRAYEQDAQQWAKKMEDLLDNIDEAVKSSDGYLSTSSSKKWRQKYRRLLKKADIECPPPDPESSPKKRGRLARGTSRNLLERLRNFEENVLCFMDYTEVPFTNNQGERDLRMSKVQQKISGCFRSMLGAEIFCAVRSYLSTCQKNNVSVGEALESLFNGRWPDFIQEKLDFLENCAE